MSVIRTKHISDTDKFIRHYTSGSRSGHTLVPSVQSQPGGRIGSLSTSSGIKPIPIKNNTKALELISEGVPPTGPITVPQRTVMRKRQSKRKSQTKKRGKASPKPSGTKPSAAKKKRSPPSTTKKTTASAKKRPASSSSSSRRRSLPADVI